jgi:hypothetical protein
MLSRAASSTSSFAAAGRSRISLAAKNNFRLFSSTTVAKDGDYDVVVVGAFVRSSWSGVEWNGMHWIELN